MSHQSRIPLGIVLLIGLAVRVLIANYYSPALYPDSSEYVRFAEQMRSGDLTAYDGLRTPAYPLLLAQTGLSFDAVRLVQMAAGLATTALLYAAAIRHCRSWVPAFVISLWFTLSLNHLFFESAILTETVSTLLLVWSWRQMIAWMEYPEGPLRNTFWLAISTSLAWLTRPLLVFLVPLYGVVIAAGLATRRIAPSEKARRLAAFLFPTIAILTGWCFFNQVALGYFGISTTLGLNLVNHSGALMADAPPEYAEIRDIFMQTLQGRPGGSERHVMAIWEAYPAMMERTKLSLPALSQQLGRLSVALFIAHPQAYLTSAVRAWTAFWESTIYWYPNQIKSPVIRDWLVTVLDAQDAARAWLHWLFGLAALSLLAPPLRRRMHGLNVIVLTMLIVGAGSVAQAFLEYGENARYAVPFQPLILWAVIVWLWSLFDPRKTV